VSSAKPRLRSDLSIVEQVFRGETSYIVKDSAARRYFRFGAAEIRVMRCFDGERDAAGIAEALAAEGLRISEAAVEAFARKLSATGFLERTVAERSTLQLERLRAERSRGRRPALFRGELLRMRWSFGDPDRMLERVLPHIRWMFTPAFVVASALLFVVYLVVLAREWGSFSAALADTLSLHAITLGNIVILWLTGGAVILIHELGHGFACKYFGGEVRELGFMLLYFQPAFYCNVSDAWSFPERRARLWVTAAGSWIQLVVAALAALVWAVVEPGTLVARVAMAAMLVGGVTTLFTNANPLLPLDGYFALTDWLEIPNLRQRALAHFRWWMKGRVFRLVLPEPPASARERRVFLLYGALSVVYVTAIFAFMGVVALSWASRASGWLGVLLVVIAILVMLRGKIAEWRRTASLALRSVPAKRQLLRRRTVLAVLAAVVVVLMLPWTLTAPGELVAYPTVLRAMTAPDSGIVESVLATEGARVAVGAPVARLVDRSLDAALLAAARAVDSLALSEGSARAAGMAGEVARLGAERQASMALLAALGRRAEALTLRAAVAGVVVTPRPEELVGRRLEAGDTLLVLATLDSVEVRVALTGAGATRVRAGQVVHLVSYADVAHPWSGLTGSVSEAGVAGVVEARVHIPASEVWRAGARGEASVELSRSTVAGALWWNLRRRLRADLWL
jgi:multidrug efflux pump subunit AcrA (membrane-fusion protein)